MSLNINGFGSYPYLNPRRDNPLQPEGAGSKVTTKSHTGPRVMTEEEVAYQNANWEYQDALATGNQEAIAKAAEKLRIAYNNYVNPTWNREQTDETRATGEQPTVDDVDAPTTVSLPNEVTRLTEEEALAQGYILIKTPEDLMNITNIDNPKYILMNDIDLSGIDWIPLGQDWPVDFNGEINGNGFSIKNMNIDASKCGGTNSSGLGLFAKIGDATICNLTFENASINADYDWSMNSCGFIAGVVVGDLTIDNVAASGTINGKEPLGGLIGRVNGALQDNDCLGDTYYDIKISNVNTDINISGTSNVGGIIGWVDHAYQRGVGANRFITGIGSNITLDNCNTSGNIFLGRKNGGGLIGGSEEAIITILNSSSSVNICAKNPDAPIDCVGGLFGYLDGAKVTFCNSNFMGNIYSDTVLKGDIYGYYGGEARICFYNKDGGLPESDILLNWPEPIESLDHLKEIDPETGEEYYKITISTLSGMDKIVELIQHYPELADKIKFVVTFDFEQIDGAYKVSEVAIENFYSIIGNRNGIIQTVTNEGCEVYLDNQTGLALVSSLVIIKVNQQQGIGKEYGKEDGIFSDNNSEQNTGDYYGKYPPTNSVPDLAYDEDNDQYKVWLGNSEFGYVDVDIEFDYEGQQTTIIKRLTDGEVAVRRNLLRMFWSFSSWFADALKELFPLEDGFDLNESEIYQEYLKIREAATDPDKAAYEYLKGLEKSGVELPNWFKRFMYAYEIERKMVEHYNSWFGTCGMGGANCEKTYPMLNEDGNPRYMTLWGEELIQVTLEDGTIEYRFLDGRKYEGRNIVEMRGKHVEDDKGRPVFKTPDGDFIYKESNGNGTYTYYDDDGNVYNGSIEVLQMVLELFDPGQTYNDFDDEFYSWLNMLEDGDLSFLN